MVTEIIMPKMGQTMEKGKVFKWLKKEGDTVQSGEPLLEIETDKTTIESEARGSGILKKILAQEGDEAQIAEVIGYIGAEDESLSEAEMKARAATSKPEVETVLAKPKPTKEVHPEPERRVKASPLAKKLAEEKGVNLALVKGTGPGGRITKEDVLDFLAEKPAATFELLPMTSMRRAIAAKMTESKTHVPHFYISVDVDMTEAVKMRDELLPMFETETGVRLSYTSLLVKAVALGLKEYPQLNATLDGENIKLWKNVNVGIAVGLEDGLIVPVLRNASELSLREITVRTAELVAKARDKKLREDEFTGGTFTVSNMGALNVDSFIAIINVPETAILAAGRIKDKAVVINGNIVARKMMTLTLSADHRVVDGVYAAKFLGKVKDLLESPRILI
jgi:pyruvate dehydrogenase E2 component (dihydrolipoamide acetyltransferase)